MSHGPLRLTRDTRRIPANCPGPSQRYWLPYSGQWGGRVGARALLYRPIAAAILLVARRSFSRVIASCILAHRLSMYMDTNTSYSDILVYVCTLNTVQYCTSIL